MVDRNNARSEIHTNGSLMSLLVDKYLTLFFEVE